MRSPREAAVIRDCIEALELDLEGLVVGTEAATGAYAWNAALAATAGADKVLCFAKDSRFGTAVDAYAQTLHACSHVGIAEGVVEPTSRDRLLASSDVITNSGHLRPFLRDDVAAMKPTACLPLMWETWEFRADQLDLGACKERGILVLGTDEAMPPLAMHRYNGQLASALLHRLGREVLRNRILVLGDQTADHVASELALQGATVLRGGPPASDLPYESFASGMAWPHGPLDAIVVADHMGQTKIIGSEGRIPIGALGSMGMPPIAVITGELDPDELHAAGIRVVPEQRAAPGHMWFRPDEIGPRPILELFATGLKVGEVMARARREGKTPLDAARHALSNAPAMDFLAPDAWLS